MLKLCSTLLLLLASAHAGAITTSIYSTEDKVGNDVSGLLPVEIAGSADWFVRRFTVPDAALILSLNEFKITLTVSDDGDKNAAEAGDICVGRCSTGILVGSFNQKLPAGSTIITFMVNPLDFAAVIADIKGNGRVPVILQEAGGDFFVEDLQIEINGVLATPEPRQSLCVLIAFAAAACVRRFRTTV